MTAEGVPHNAHGEREQHRSASQSVAESEYMVYLELVESEVAVVVVVHLVEHLQQQVLHLREVHQGVCKARAKGKRSRG